MCGPIGLPRRRHEGRPYQLPSLTLPTPTPRHSSPFPMKFVSNWGCSANVALLTPLCKPASLQAPTLSRGPRDIIYRLPPPNAANCAAFMPTSSPSIVVNPVSSTSTSFAFTARAAANIQSFCFWLSLLTSFTTTGSPKRKCLRFLGSKGSSWSLRKNRCRISAGRIAKSL